MQHSQDDPRGRRPPRYRMLEPVREYAAEQLAAAGDGEAVRERHARFFLAVADAFEPEARRPQLAAWLDRLALDHDNLRAALDWCLGAPERAEHGLRAGAALLHFWLIRGHAREAHQRLAALLSCPGAQRPSPGRSRALVAAGLLALWQGGDDAAAERLLEESLTLCHTLGDRRGTADALRVLGELAQRRDDAAGALARFRESLALSREAGDDNGVRWSLEDLADLAAEGGADHEAIALYEEALGLARRAGDQHSIAALLRSAGVLALTRHDHARALATLRESLGISFALRDRTCGALGLDALARALGAVGRAGQAIRVFAAAAALREATGMVVPAAGRAAHDRWVAEARRGLDDQAFAAAWAEGRALTFEQAVALAIAVVPPSHPAPRPAGAGRARPAGRTTTVPGHP